MLLHFIVGPRISPGGLFNKIYFEMGPYSNVGAYLAAAKNITKANFLVLFDSGQ